jgi:lysophospholipase
MEPSPNSLEKSFFNPVVDYQKATGPGNDFISTSMARVLCIYTGGTIGMKATDDGYIPAENWFFDTLKSSPKFHTRNGGDDLFRECVKFIDTAEQVSCIELPCLVSPKSVYGKQIQYCILEYQPLLDSANMTSNGYFCAVRV